MRILEIIRKSTKEQIRNFWILALTLIMAPFFVGVYYLINESTKPVYDVLFVNLDKGKPSNNAVLNYGEDLIRIAETGIDSSVAIPLTIKHTGTLDSAYNLINKKKADAIIVIPTGFSDSLSLGLTEKRPVPPQIELIGDMTDFNYMIAAIYGSEIVRIYIEGVSGFPSPFILKETSLSHTEGFSDFDLYMPGLMVLSIIMLMFTASIAFVAEIENGTILRYRLSGVRTVEFIGGITIIQLVIGIVSALITLGTAQILGFQYNGSLLLAMLLVCLTGLSIIAFSVILGALTKSANEILVIGNFPLFLFMFFTGAVFPMQGKALFTVAGYGINLQGLMSPTHAVNAMKKVMLMNYSFEEILPEILCVVFLTLLYFAIGIWIFNRRHMRFGG